MRSKLLWLSSVFVAVIVGELIPLLFWRDFFYADDSQAGAFGQWYKIGDRLLTGNWSLVNPTVWQSGNYLAEGAWGIFSPVVSAVGLASHLATNAAVFTTVVKLAFLLFAAFGIWVLAREYGASVPWASAIAVAAPLAGFTQYMDGASWANGLMAWSFFPWAWVLARRAIRGGHSPMLAIAASIGLIGIGYVHATLALGFMLICLIVEAYLKRWRSAIVRAWTVAACAGLFAIIVHLPTLLVAPVSGRQTGIANDGVLTVDLGDLVTANVAVANPQVHWFFTDFPAAPLFYFAWFLPLAAFIDWRAFMTVLRERISVVMVFGLALLGMLFLPSTLGPLRYPIRLVPYVALTTLLLLAIGLSLAPARATRLRFGGVAAWLVLSSGFAFAITPNHAKWILASGVLEFVAFWLLYRYSSGRSLLPWRTGLRGEAPEAVPSETKQDTGAGRIVPVLGSAVAILVTLIMLVPQHKLMFMAPVRDYNVSDNVSTYKDVLDGAEGDAFVVGTVGVSTPTSERLWKQTSVSNLYYVAGASVQNAYSAVYYPAYSNLLCMDYNGFTCPTAYKTLFTVQAETHKTYADLMGISSVSVIKSSVPKSLWSKVPSGWHVVQDTADTRLISRDKSIEGAGGVVWSSAGTKVTEIKHDDMGVTFRVDSVPSGGGKVALSRIPWPGYRANSGASVEKTPFAGFLTQVNLSPASAGKTVTVSYWSPGWLLELAAGLLLVLIAGTWVILRQIAGSRARRGVAPRPIDVIARQPAEYARLL